MTAMTILGLSPVGPAQAASTHAATQETDTPLRVVLSQISPESASPGDTLTLAGTVTNTSHKPLDGLSMLAGVGQEIHNRGTLAQDFTDSPGLRQVLRTTTSDAPSSLAPGGSAPFQLTVNLRANGLEGDHATVYPIEVRFDNEQTTSLGQADSFLPYFPGPVTAPLRIVWLWPVTAPPALDAGGAVGNADVPAAFQTTGQLRQLIDLTHAPAGTKGAAARYAPVTWAVDPSVLQTAQVVSQSGWVRTGSPDQKRSASSAAADWLSDLRADTEGSDVIPLPYGDVDAVALVRAGLTEDLANALALGRSQITDALPGANVLDVAWPVNGAVDQATVNAYAAAGVDGLLINGDQLPASDSADSPTPSAVTTVETQGPTERALAIDPLAQQLLAGNGKDQPSSRMSVQRLLALLAVVVDEHPNQLPSRDLVLAMPRGLDPDPDWARALLQGTAAQPWLAPVTLSDTRNDPPGIRMPLQPYPDAARTSELSGSSLTGSADSVATLRATVASVRGMLPDDTLTRPLDQALTRAESLAWRRGASTADAESAPQTDSRTLREGVARLTAELLHGVRAGVAGQVTLGSRHGKVPVTVENTLSEDVTVALSLGTTDRTKLASPRTTTYTIPAGTKQRILLPADTQRAGTFRAQLTLSTPSGLTITSTPLTVHSSAYGTITLVITIAALTILVLALLIRFSHRIRRWRTGRATGAADPA